MHGLGKDDCVIIVTEAMKIAFKKGLPQPLLYRNGKLVLLLEFMRKVKPLWKSEATCVVVTYDRTKVNRVDMCFCDVKTFLASINDEETKKFLRSYNIKTCVPLLITHGSTMWCNMCAYYPKKEVTCCKVLRSVSTQGLNELEMPCEDVGEDVPEADFEVKDEMVNSILLELRSATSELRVCEFLERFNEQGKIVLQHNGRILPVNLDDALEIQGSAMATLCTVKASEDWRRVNFFGLLKTCIRQAL